MSTKILNTLQTRKTLLYIPCYIIEHKTTQRKITDLPHNYPNQDPHLLFRKYNSKKPVYILKLKIAQQYKGDTIKLTNPITALYRGTPYKYKETLLNKHGQLLYPTNMPQKTRRQRYKSAKVGKEHKELTYQLSKASRRGGFEITVDYKTYTHLHNGDNYFLTNPEQIILETLY